MPPPEILHLPANTHCKQVGHELLDKDGHPTKHLSWLHENGLPFCETCHDDYQKMKDAHARPHDEDGKPITHCEKGHELHHKNIGHISMGSAGVMSYCKDCHEKEEVKKAINPPKEMMPPDASRNLTGVEDRANWRMGWSGPVRHSKLAEIAHTNCVRCGQAFKPGEQMTIEHPIPLSLGGRNMESTILYSHDKENSAAGNTPVSVNQMRKWHTNTFGEAPTKGHLALYQNIVGHHGRKTPEDTAVFHTSAWDNFHSIRNSWDDDMGKQMYEELTPGAKRAYDKWKTTQMGSRFGGKGEENKKWRNFKNYRINGFSPEFNEEGKLTNAMTNRKKLNGTIQNWFGTLQNHLAARGVRDNKNRLIVDKQGQIHKDWQGKWDEMMNEPLKLHGPSGGVVPHRHLATVLQAADQHQRTKQWEKLSNGQRELPAVSPELRARILQRLHQEKMARPQNAEKDPDKVKVGTLIRAREVKKACVHLGFTSQTTTRPLPTMKIGNLQNENATRRLILRK